MKHIVCFICIALFVLFHKNIKAQDLPHQMTPEEEILWTSFYQSLLENKAVVSPPPGNVRAMGEWEENMAVCITWTSYQSILAEIVRYAQMECKVIINCSDSNSVKTYLSQKNIPLTTNLKFNKVAFNSIWIRDYGSYSVYKNDVDSLYLIDWKYNRPSRPDDDVMPLSHASLLGLPIYEMNANPYLLVATGGNIMFDGRGTAMSSKLILTENSSLTETQVNTRMNQFFGVDRYIKYTVLPYDGIHHIDMHMKFLDEETILFGQYPSGTSDGPQIEANLQYLLSNFNSVFGTPYKVIRIPMPKQSASSNTWPSNGGDYKTYTNGVFINKTYIYPTYYQMYDTTALRIYKEALPGYKLIGIDSDNQDANIISQSGSIHCITNNIGVQYPLLISHKRLEDTNNNSTPYEVSALIKHVSGIQHAEVYYRTDTTQPYLSSQMTLTNQNENIWTGYIPPQTGGTRVYYYISAAAVSGKVQVRPITAPEGYWNFLVLLTAGNTGNTSEQASISEIYPNPARAITCIPVNSSNSANCNIMLLDINGKVIEQIFSGKLHNGTNNFFFDASTLPVGVYLVRLQTNESIEMKKVIVYGY